MNEKEILEILYTRKDSSVKFGLERINELLSYLDNPQNKVKFIHITGTNGKGSITTMLSNSLIESGYKVGKYISPYVDNFFERIQINNKYITKNEVNVILKDILKAIDKMEDKPSTFEIITAIAFQYFYINNCDIVCLEVGMGGRFDATNCIKNTLISIISVIDYDHMDYLGNTIEEITFEKCGIIKPNKVTISYPIQKRNAYLMIKAMTDIRNNKFIEIDLNNLKDINKIEYNYSFIYKSNKYELGLNGKYQIYNSLVVIEAIEELNKQGFNINYNNVFNALKNTSFVGRLQKIKDNPTVIIDGAHNISGAKSLKEFIEENFKNKKITLITAMKKGKQAEEYYKEISKLFSKIIITKIENEYIVGEDLKEIESIIKESNNNVEIELSHKAAYDKAISNSDIVIISGSLYLVSEFYNLLKEDLWKDL